MSDRRAMRSAANTSATPCNAHTASGKSRGGESDSPATTTVGVTRGRGVARDRVGGAMPGVVGEEDGVSDGEAPVIVGIAGSLPATVGAGVREGGYVAVGLGVFVACGVSVGGSVEVGVRVEVAVGAAGTLVSVTLTETGTVRPCASR